VNNAELTSSVSIGIAIAGDDQETAESMIRDADTAMYCAKDAGRDAVALFDQTMRDRVSQRLDLERDLHHALERDELLLHYQPIVDMASGRLMGFEALLRWAHPAWGMISPLSFIPVAEDTGLIVEIGEWVLIEATRQMAQWRHELPHGDELSISVNVSARQLRDQSMVGRVQAALANSGLPRDRLTLELTESTLMADPDDAVELLTRLKQTGIKLAIDDFGTGYSSLAYLRRFPVDVVKIDRAFVMDLDNLDSSDATLVAAIVAMADALDVSTVAEGVETESQAERLLSLGCSVAQGYLYSRPAPADEISAMVDRIRGRVRARLRPVRDAFSA
jgi:EAL domain-containing protein (putative c-di-GMP-specific phosphodiesterase class I)